MAMARLIAVLVVLGLVAGTAATGVAPAAETTKPVTTASKSPAANALGWNRDNVTVTLTATDEAGGSGVKRITYSVSGAQPISSTTVSAASAAFVISAEGTSTITYWATDTATPENTEDAKTLNVNIDRSPPSISIIQPEGVTLVAQGTFSPARWTCADAGPSGVDTCEATEGSPVTTLGTRALDSSSLGIRYLRIKVVDRAGNEATAERSYTVVPRKPLDTGGDVPNSGQITAKGTIFMPSAKKCVRNNPGLKIEVKIPKGKSILGAVVFFDGKRKTSVPSRRLNKPIRIRHLPRRRFKTKVTLITAQGGRVRMTKTYRYCGYGLKSKKK